MYPAILVPAKVRENLMTSVVKILLQRYNPEHILTVLRQVKVSAPSGKSTTPACRKAGIIAQNLCRWQKEYGGLKIELAPQMKYLEKEDARLWWLSEGYEPGQTSLDGCSGGKSIRPAR